jgi:hypothetical protein
MIAPTKERDVPAIVRAALEKHGAKRDALIPILSEINQVLGYIPGEAFREVRKQIHNPAEQVYLAESQLFTLASFMTCSPPNTRTARDQVLRKCSVPCGGQ